MNLHYYKVILPSYPLDLLTYSSVDELESGVAVIVSLRNKNLLGYVIEKENGIPKFKTKNIISVLSKNYWFDKKTVELAKWMSRFYVNSLGQVFDMFIPKGLKLKNNKIEYKAVIKKFIRIKNLSIAKEKDLGILKKVESLSPLLLRMIKDFNISLSVVNRLVKEEVLEKFEAPVDRVIKKPDISCTIEKIPMNTSQNNVYNSVIKVNKGRFLLHGVTGSGKTRVYIHLANFYYKQNKTILILVPEIGLTPQIFKEFYSIFGEESIYYHGKLNNNERHEIWLGVKNGKYKVIIGTRSSIFLPFQDLGLVIVDEEHDGSYFQDDASPYYNAKEVILKSALDSTIIFGSATPSIETYRLYKLGKFQLLRMMDRATKIEKPEIDIVDLSKEKHVELLFPNKTLSSISEELSLNNRVIIYFNRRGYFTIIVCESCGKMFECPNCSSNMIYHKSDNVYKCHLCGYTSTHLPRCSCGGAYKEKGIGIQAVEESLHSLFPETKIVRMDTDIVSKTKHGHEKVLDEFKSSDASILLGTQMVTKGHDVKKVSLVVVLLADLGMGIPDFRNDERIYQILIQVIGRAGRHDKKGKAIIQTFNVENKIFDYVINKSYEDFYDDIIKQRELFNYPPFTNISLIILKHRDKKTVYMDAKFIFEKIKKGIDYKTNDISETILKKLIPDKLLPPFAPAMERKDNYFYRYIMLRDRDKIKLIKFLWLIRNNFGNLNSKLIIKTAPIFIT